MWGCSITVLRLMLTVICMFIIQKNKAIYEIDASGRMRSIVNQNQLYALNETVDGRFSNGGLLYGFEIRETASGRELLFRADNKTIAGVKILKGGDLDGDGFVDAVDIAVLKTLLGTTIANIKPSYKEYAAMVESDQIALVTYQRGDLNGNNIVSHGDVKAMQQYYAFLDGDADMNQVVDFSDAVTLVNHYGEGSANWLGGDFDGNGEG